MNDAQPNTKVTIIIEEGDRTVTIRVPKAQEVVFKDRPVPDFKLAPLSSLNRYATNIVDLSLTLRATFDPETQRIYIAENSTKAVEVES